MQATTIKPASQNRYVSSYGVSAPTTHAAQAIWNHLSLGLMFHLHFATYWTPFQWYPRQITKSKLRREIPCRSSFGAHMEPTLDALGLVPVIWCVFVWAPPVHSSNAHYTSAGISPRLIAALLARRPRFSTAISNCSAYAKLSRSDKHVFALLPGILRSLWYFQQCSLIFRSPLCTACASA